VFEPAYGTPPRLCSQTGSGSGLGAVTNTGDIFCASSRRNPATVTVKSPNTLLDPKPGASHMPCSLRPRQRGSFFVGRPPPQGNDRTPGGSVSLRTERPRRGLQILAPRSGSGRTVNPLAISDRAQPSQSQELLNDEAARWKSNGKTRAAKTAYRGAIEPSSHEPAGLCH
jgi:hypothetical protein